MSFMYKNAVIPDMNPGSRSFNKSCKPYDMLDSRFTLRSPGMTKHGFTLIELLVVVLIIGILSSVALPQYQKAVRKSRVAEAKTLLRSLGQAEDLYFMATGSTNSLLKEDWENLDISIPGDSANWTFEQEECITGTNGLTGCGVFAVPKRESGYQIEYWSPNYDGGEDLAGNFYCSSSSPEGEHICQGMSMGAKIYDRYPL